MQPTARRLNPRARQVVLALAAGALTACADLLAVESAGLPAISTNGKELYMVSRQPGSGVGGQPFRNDLYVSTRRGAP